MNERHARVALGLRSTAQCLGRIGAEAGIFERLGIDFEIAAFETAAPRALAGLLDGEFDFTEMGAVPVVNGVLDGADPVILLAPEPMSALFVIARAGIAEPAALAGGRIGVLSETGQTGVTAHAMLERWGLDDAVALAPLGAYPRIYEAIAAGEIEAGLLTADYRFAGETAHGMVALVDLGDAFGYQGTIVATTRRVIAERRPLVAAVVRGYVGAIHHFKTARAAVLPALERHLGFDDSRTVVAAYDFYVPRFQAYPTPSEDGIERVIEAFRGRYPAAGRLAPEEVCDLSFLDDIKKDGLITRLYGEDGVQDG